MRSPFLFLVTDRYSMTQLSFLSTNIQMMLEISLRTNTTYDNVKPMRQIKFSQLVT